MGQRIAAAHEELERVVEAGGVRLALVGDRPELGDVVAEQFGIDARLPRRHPVDVAAQRVDLAVVGDHAIGMREAPGRERVGREALMHERERGFEARIEQVLVVGTELADEHHALVDDGAAGHRDRVIFRRRAGPDRIDAIGDDLADDEELALEIVFVGDVRPAADEGLAHHGLDGLHPLAEARIVDGHVAPAEHALTLGGDGLLDDLFDLGARGGVARHEELADRVMPGLRQLDAELAAFGGEERVRDLRQHAAAVAERRIGADRSAMVEVDEDLQVPFPGSRATCGSSCRRRTRRRRSRARWRDRKALARAASADRRRAGGSRANARGVSSGFAFIFQLPRPLVDFNGRRSSDFARSSLNSVDGIRTGRRQPRAPQAASGGGFFSSRFDLCVRHRFSPRAPPTRPAPAAQLKWSVKLSYFART